MGLATLANRQNARLSRVAWAILGCMKHMRSMTCGDIAAYVLVCWFQLWVNCVFCVMRGGRRCVVLAK